MHQEETNPATVVVSDTPPRHRTLNAALTQVVAVFCLVGALGISLIFTFHARHTILKHADDRLLAAVEFAHELQGPGFHDRITGEDSLSREQFTHILDRNTALCRRLGLQYLWSVLVLEDRIVFTTAARADVNDPASAHASFFETHRDPHSFDAALGTPDVPVFSSFRNEWGAGRQVLVPRLDSQRRRYITGASIQLDALNSLVWNAARLAVLAAAALFLPAWLITSRLTRRITEVFSRINAAAVQMKEGNLDVALPTSGIAEARQVCATLDGMRQELRGRIEALRASEKKHRMLVQNLNAGVVVHAPDTHILLVNDRASVLLGLTPDQMLGKTAIDPAWRFVHEDGSVMPPDEYPVNQVISRQTQVADFIVGVQRPATKDVAWVLVNAFPEFAATGTLRQVVVTFVDITERRRAEEALRQQYELAMRLSRAASLEESLRLCLTAALRISEMDCGGIYLVDGERGGLRLAAHQGLAEESATRAAYFGPDSPNWRLVVHGAPLYTRHDAASPSHQLLHEGLRALALIPILYDGRPIACLNLASRQRDDFPEAARRAVEAVGALAGSFISRSLLFADLTTSEARFRELAEQLPEVVFELDANHRLTFANRRAFELFGYSPEDLADGLDPLNMVVPEDRPRAREMLARHVREEALGAQEYTGLRKDGSTFPLLLHNRGIFREGVHVGSRGVIIDITEGKAAEAERERLQAQLTQAQKMESVGRLAGGVAHDFNNMLQAILGNAMLALQDLPPDSPWHENLSEIRSCAQRSADLTRQLLAFARKQTIAPKVLDLNATVEGMLKMLRRLIGEEIELAWKPGRALWPVRVDPSQVDQILANLCVNARDAIAGVGTVTIETDNVVFAEEYCALHAGFVPGEYVLLAASDNGCGMDAETLSHLFEPFYTTKETGKGTGLGLASVYGAVKQKSGFVHVCSEPGRGTTFKIYLPRHAVNAAETDEREPQGEVRGSETILLVEDEPAILNLTRLVLERLGYTVLAARTPSEAIRLARECPGRIGLLITDVVMPEMNGRDLAKDLLSIRPNIQRLFMSGYTADVIAHQGVLDPGVHFIQKPFSPRALGAKVREVLGNDGGGAGGKS